MFEKYFFPFIISTHLFKIKLKFLGNLTAPNRANGKRQFGGRCKTVIALNKRNPCCVHANHNKLHFDVSASRCKKYHTYLGLQLKILFPLLLLYLHIEIIGSRQESRKQNCVCMSIFVCYCFFFFF